MSDTPSAHNASDHSVSLHECDGSNHHPETHEVLIDYGVHAPFIAALRAVLAEDAAAFASCIDASPHVLETTYRGWPLLHHIVLMNWEKGMDIYREKNGRFDIKSEDFVTRFGGASGSFHTSLCHAGGQTLLHVVALNRPSCLEKMCRAFPQADTVDFNARMPAFYLSHRDMPKDDQVLVMARVAQQSLIHLARERSNHVVLDERPLMDGVWSFEVPASVCASLICEIALLDQSMPNSMHRYGKILLPQMQRAIHNLVAHVLPADDVRRVNHIHAFYVEYSELVGQKSLDSHMDDSHWTINLCLSVSHDLRGSELVFDLQNVEYRHNHAGRGIVHRGCMRHHVRPLECGHRENIIVWVGLAPAFEATAKPATEEGRSSARSL